MMMRKPSLVIDTWMAHRHARQMARANTVTVEQRRAERTRQVVGAVLVFFALVMLMEVVLVPGSMIRNHLKSAPTAPLGPTTAETPLLLVGQQQLEILCRSVELEWTELQRDTQRRIGIDLAAPDRKLLPASLDANPTAAVAWADISRSAPELARELSDVQATARTTAAHINAGMPHDEEEGNIHDAINRLQLAQRSLRRLGAEIDHIELFLHAATRPNQPKETAR